MGKILIESRITALLFDTRDSHQRRHHVPIHKLVPAGTAPKDALWHHPPSDSDRTDHPGPDLQQGDRRIRSPRHLDGISAFPDAVIDLPLLDRHPRRSRLSHAPYPTTESLRSSRASMAVYCRHDNQLLDTVVFGLQWYFTSASSDESEYIPDMVKEGLDNLRKEQERHGAVVPHETASSMILIIGLTLVRVYFGFIVMSFARQVLQKQMQIIVLEAPSDVNDHDGPFGNGLPEGEGRRGRIGRVLVSYGRDYWLGQPENEWADQGYSKQGA